MRPPAPALDVTAEELEALLEGVREALGEAGYQRTEGGHPHPELRDAVAGES